ncbi:MAG: tetratricopeptide repeat protein [Rubrivivax sp.]|nr:tetratricopeptide repeat protein [Rubrivivax sp.]
MTVSSLRRSAACRWAASAALVLFCLGAHAQQAAPAASGDATAQAKPPVLNSNLDAPLFYQLLIGEIELSDGQAGNAYQIMLDAARRGRDEQLFRRATEIALQARAGEQALAATRAWRTAHPQSLEAIRLQLQILLSLNRLNELGEPLHALLTATPVAERPAVIGALPRFLQRAADKRQAATLLEEVLQPYVADASTRAAAQAAIGRAWLAAGDAERALALARRIQLEDPMSSAGPVLALELMPTRPEAESLVVAYLRVPNAEIDVRRAYAGTLVTLQRYAEAIAQLEAVTRQQPDLAGPWLTLGALQLEMRQTQAAEASLQRYVQLAQAQPGGASPANTDDDDDDEASPGAGAGVSGQGLTQAWLLLAQAAEQRGDYAAAEAWLARIDNPQRALEVQTRRAMLLARQGRVAQARELLRSLPERNVADARAKLIAEAQVLREVKQWGEAYAVLQGASQRFPDDVDLMYEQAMMAEKVGQLDAMEALLRRVIALKPDHAHAYNALGYSLADRNLRLPEAKGLIARALELTPGDPFITDSLGWVEFRLGNRDEALRLLRQAYKARPDAEIGAHLGEVLWAMGRRDEARQVWAEVASRDAANDVLRETMVRLKAQ